MTTTTGVTEQPEDEIDEQEPGSTFVLGAEGWESVDYVVPAADWALQADGSFLSPDERTRSWPEAGPEPV